MWTFQAVINCPATHERLYYFVPQIEKKLKFHSKTERNKFENKQSLCLETSSVLKYHYSTSFVRTPSPKDFFGQSKHSFLGDCISAFLSRRKHLFVLFL